MAAAGLDAVADQLLQRPLVRSGSQHCWREARRVHSYGLPGSKSAMLSTGQIVVDVKPDAPAMNRAESAVIVVDSRAARSIEMSQFGLGP